MCNGVIVREELYFSLHVKIVVVDNVLRAPLPRTKMQFVKHSRLIRSICQTAFEITHCADSFAGCSLLLEHFLDHIGYIFIMGSLKADTVVLALKGYYSVSYLCLATPLLAVFELYLF